MTEPYRPVALGLTHLPHLPTFSDPVHTTADLGELSAMLDELRAVLAGAPRQTSDRLYIFQPQWLRDQRGLAFVGFRGVRRAHIPLEVEQAVACADAALVARLPENPDVLSYSCRPLADGNWINLVLLRHPEAVTRWHRDPLHREVSQDLSPRYYDHVRLHGGVLPQGLTGSLGHTHTQYLDFSQSSVWTARRSAV